MTKVEVIKEQLGERAGTFDADGAYESAAVQWILSLQEDNEAVRFAAQKLQSRAQELMKFLRDNVGGDENSTVEIIVNGEHNDLFTSYLVRLLGDLEEACKHEFLD